MPEHANKINISELSDEEFESLARLLEEKGYFKDINELYIVAGKFLSYSVDFMKKIGVLSEFVRYLPHLEGEVFVEMYKQRPKIYGGNPFE